MGSVFLKDEQDKPLLAELYTKNIYSGSDKNPNEVKMISVADGNDNKFDVTFKGAFDEPMV